MSNTIVASPAVTGNIGSCKTEVAEVITYRGVINVGKSQITTNSCTGAVTTYNYSELNTTTFIGTPMLLIAAFVAITFWVGVLRAGR